jgi:hypothetical protein
MEAGIYRLEEPLYDFSRPLLDIHITDCDLMAEYFSRKRKIRREPRESHKFFSLAQVLR